MIDLAPLPNFQLLRLYPTYQAVSNLSKNLGLDQSYYLGDDKGRKLVKTICDMLPDITAAMVKSYEEGIVFAYP